jgi:hypothetical protein
MSRSTLSELIALVRGMTNAGTADYTIGTASFWDSDQLQQVLDRHRRDVFNEALYPIGTWGVNTVNYYDYYSQFDNFEQTDAGTAVWWIENGTGVNVGTASITVDYIRGHIKFSSDTLGTAYYLTGRSYDLNAAAADIWQMKATYYATNAFDFSTDNHSVKQSQIVDQCLKMANLYASKAGPNRTIVQRGDLEDDVFIE